MNATSNHAQPTRYRTTRKDERMSGSLYDQTAPDDETLAGAYVIQDGSWMGDTFSAYGPDGSGMVGSGGWETTLGAIRRDMDREQYWPDVFYVNDHGNISLVDVTTGEEVATWV